MSLSDLIERLVALKGPDRELDWAIAIAIGLVEIRFDEGNQVERAYLVTDKPIMRYLGSEGQYKWHDLPHFTASLDAALTLVPEGWDWRVSGPDWENHERVSHFAHVREYQGMSSPKRDAEGDARHSVPAIALCIAALRARAADMIERR